MKLVRRKFKRDHYLLYSFVLSMALIFLVSGYGNTQGLVDRVVAVVEDEIILYSEVLLVAQTYAAQLRINLSTEPEKFKLLKKDARNYLIDQKVLLAKAIIDSIEVTEEEIEAEINQNITQLIKQLGSEKRVEEELGYSLKQLRRIYHDDIKKNLMIAKRRQQYMAEVKITPREVEEFYNTYKDSLPDLPESYNISHILKEVHPGEEARKQALERINKIYELVQANEDFSTLAENYSDDTGSAGNGGRLGFINRGDLESKIFEEAAFSLKEEEVSGIIESGLGFHIIKCLERRGERVSVQHILVSLKGTRNEEIKIVSELMRLKKEAENGADFSELALKHSDDPEVEDNGGNLGWVEIDQLDIPEFERELNKLDVGEISNPFKTRFGYHILRLNEKTESRKLSLEEDQFMIQQSAQTKKSTESFDKWLSELKKSTYIEIKTEEL